MVFGPYYLGRWTLRGCPLLLIAINPVVVCSLHRVSSMRAVHNILQPCLTAFGPRPSNAQKALHQQSPPPPNIKSPPTPSNIKYSTLRYVLKYFGSILIRESKPYWEYFMFLILGGWGGLILRKGDYRELLENCAPRPPTPSALEPQSFKVGFRVLRFRLGI